MPFNFWCENIEQRSACTGCNNKGDLVLEEQGNHKCCMNKDIELKEMGVVVAGHIGPRMTKPQIVADRKKRSTQHFQKDVLPTLGKAEKKHFAKKAELKKK